MTKDNISVHGLWIGSNLSPVELLCLNSFIANGHEFHLWLYDKLETPIPAEVILEDASKIIPADQVFCYKNINQFGHGKGSYAGFSDIFRYKLLHEIGGWWTDMDVICLKPLDFPEPYIFRTHHDFPVVGNIMKCPAGSELMIRCFESAFSKVTVENTDWNLPILILNDYISEFKLSTFIREFTNRDSWLYIRKLLLKNVHIPKHWFALHLVNEEWRRNRIDKEFIPRFSFIGKKMKLYGIKNSATLGFSIKNYLHILIPRDVVIQTYWFFAKIFWKTVRLVIKERKSSV